MMKDEVAGCCGVARDGAAASPPAPCAGAAPVSRSNETVAFAGGTFWIGTARPQIAFDGEALRRVRAEPFRIEPFAVTNRRFQDFVAATRYETDAERYGWSYVFAGLLPHPEAQRAHARGTPWWKRVDGATWKEPEGPGSQIATRLDHPVVQVSWRDAKAFAEWAGGRLPSEAEWEVAARAGNPDARFPWGDEEPSDDKILCNIWQGDFPSRNTCADGFFGTAPVDAFEPNAAGLYNMAGNVWEWCADAFQVRSVKAVARQRNEQARKGSEKVLKGGSFLCHRSYCYRYRIAARIGLASDSTSSNMGFRIVYY